MQQIVEHYIQRNILRSLSRAGQLTFSQLRPDGIENGIFSYHLKQLVRDELVAREGDKYTLTADGIRYVSRATRTNIDVLPQPKLFCLLLIENESGEFILHRRNAQPFLGSYTFPGGAVFFGENLKGLVDRQLLEKIGSLLPMKHRGIANLRLGEEGQILSHTYAHIYYHKVDGRPLILSKDGRFTPEWINPFHRDSNDLFPDVTRIIYKVRSTEGFFFLDLTLV
ncbi:MAG TPA: NUDIX domain-containing protein [Verrucomicrobiae bacterium]|nr:NUDIX domain-containing protein [Verrucomicrobiae bacterium]